MLGKLLLTSAVIFIAFILIRQKGVKRGIEEGLLGEAEASKQKASAAAKSEDDAALEKKAELDKDIRLGAWLFLLLMVGIGGALYYTSWQDDRTIITVNLYTDGAEQATSYQVYKYQLGERSFTTLDGVIVTVAANERMEVLGLND